MQLNTQNYNFYYHLDTPDEPYHMPPDPLELFLFLNQLQTCSAKNTLEKCENSTPLLKISRYATDSLVAISVGLSVSH